MNLALSEPPYDIQAGTLPMWIFMIANIVAATVALVAALFYAYRHRDGLPVLCMIGGAFAMFSTEPILDHLLLVWYPRNSPLIFTELFDVSMPMYLIIGYPWYVGLGAYAVCKSIERGVSSRQLWKMFALIAVLDVVIELPSTASGVHIYYGNQPNFFQWGLSLTIPFVMSAVAIGCGFALRAVLNGTEGLFSRVAAVAVIPMASIAMLVGTQWPLMLALNSNWTSAAVWATAALSIALVFGIMHIGISSVAAPSDPRVPHDDKVSQAA